MRVLLVDHFDSFTHNLAQALGGLGAEVVVLRHDVPLSLALSSRPDRVVLSPGPGTPDRTGISRELLGLLPPEIPVLGVCLGMQLLALAGGGSVVRAPQPVHGKASRVRHDGQGVYEGLPAELLVGRYHSLCVEPASLPPVLQPTSWSEDGVLMGLRHALLPWEGIQFHPESVLTPRGPDLLANFLRARGMRPAEEGSLR